MTNRIETGVYTNSGILELGVALVVLCLINNEINKDPCELGES